MAEGPSQITDLGGLPSGGKQEIENMASNAGMSLGVQGDNPLPGAGAQRMSPQAPESLSLGGIGDFVANSPNQGGLASDGLPFGQGMGVQAPAMTELEQQRATAVDNAMDLFANSKIPAVKAAAAQVIRGAVISQLQGDDE
tara:strand:- start:89 stop:511 length:423 start_codon:yes stop_codon:yes gene_type:complete